MGTEANYTKTYYPNIGSDLVDKEVVVDTIHFDLYGRGQLSASGDVNISISGLKANKTYTFVLFNSGAHAIVFTDPFIYTLDGNADFTEAGDYLISLYCFEDASGSELVILGAATLVAPATTTTTTEAPTTTTTTAA